MGKRRSLMVLAGLMLGLVLLASGCTGGGAQTPDPATVASYNDQLRQMLPVRDGYQWLYHGFAEYGHTMALNRMAAAANDYRYEITGEVHDMSDGESDRDFGLSLVYYLRDGVLVQEKSEAVMLDSDFDTLELLRAPVAVGTVWTQKAKDMAGKERELDCQISAVRDENGVPVYTVLYEDKGSDYYEKREIKERAGVVSFEKLWITAEMATPIGYALYPEGTGYSNQLALTQYLPPLGVNLRFFGIAEYGHEGVMRAVDANVYRFDGEFIDGSGIPGSFKVEYHLDHQAGTVTEIVVENTRTKVPVVNSRLQGAVIMKLPLQVGTQWQVPVQFNGATREMEGQIVRMEIGGQSPFTPAFPGPDPGAAIMTVRYTVRDVPGYFRNTYIEERRFQPGRGMISFSSLMPGDLGLSGKDLEDPYQVEAAYLNNLFGYSLAYE